jgi:glycine cleavage system aminomethyltransferase T
MDLIYRYFAQRTLRIERMYPSWGHDIDKKTTPYHLNREYHISFDVKKKIFFFSNILIMDSL